MILVAYRHGLRASELTDLRWHQIDFRTSTLHVRRVKQGAASTHPILGDELRALHRLERDQDPNRRSCSLRARSAVHDCQLHPDDGSGPGKVAKLVFKAHPRICSGTPAATPWLMRGMIRGLGLAIALSSIRCAIPSCRRRGLRIFGASNDEATTYHSVRITGGSGRFCRWTLRCRISTAWSAGFSSGTGSLKTTITPSPA